MLRLAVTRTLVLELLEGHHAPLLFSLIEANRARLRQWLPWLDTTTCAQDSRLWIDHVREQYAQREAVNLGIFHQHALVGVIGLDTIDWAHRKASLGYWLGAQWQGRGLCTRSCRALLAHAFQKLELNRIELYCAPQNHRSRALPLRLGFSREGLLRRAEWLYDHYEDHELFSLLAAEWSLTAEC